MLKACARYKVTGPLILNVYARSRVTRGSDQLESLSSFGHCAHSTFDVLCNSMMFYFTFCDVFVFLFLELTIKIVQ